MATSAVGTAAPPRPAAAGAGLLDLHRAGQIPECYPQIRGLVADLAGPELIRAGQLLSRVDPDEVLRAHPGVPAVSVAITGHGTLAPLVPALTAEFARHGILVRADLGDFDGYVFDLADPSSRLYQAGTDLVLCVLDPVVVADELPVPWRPSDVEGVLARKLRLVEQLAARFAATAQGTLVLNTLPLLRDLTAQLVDHRSRARLGAAWRDANARLLRLPERHPSVVVLDLDPLAAEGVQVRDPRLSVYAKAHLSAELLAGYAREVGHLARHLTGRTKKTLVVDLDETVWGGILGDDGVDGIQVADGYRGAAFHEFQRVVKQLASQGVLVAAVSKNDPEPVRQALREHPRMTLREADFVEIIANWRPKHDNLAELAAALNLGVDSFVFVDDSGYECGLVRQALPEVAVVQLDAEPALHVQRLLADGWFDTRELTEEDRDRVARYRADRARSDFLQTFDSLDHFLHELDVQVQLRTVAEPEVPRLSQLTLRTNQFNLTTRRLQPAEVTALLDDPAAVTLTIHASDRFGDHGMVGGVFGRWDQGLLRIDNFLLSCRVFSRGIEQACLAALLRHARGAGAAAVVGEYRRSAKNGAVADFYPRNGFARIGAGDADGGPASGAGGAAASFRHDLAELPVAPPHVQLTESLGGPVP